VTRNILAARNVDRLRSAAAAGALLAFDYDGTLAPLSNNPDASRMRPETSELLRNLAHAAPVAVITGRSVADVTSRLDGIPMLAVIGNHGAEPSPFAKRAAREVASWLPMLEGVVRALDGVVIENKRQSVSVHYWHAANPAVVVAALDALLPTLPHRVHVVHGIGLVNLVPHGAPDKGDATLTLLRTHALPFAVFVGDELTDEPAFRRAEAASGLGVRVGRGSRTEASHHIASQADVDALLAELLIGATRPAPRQAASRRAAEDDARQALRLDADGADGTPTHGQHR
jgi:trehalose 6-phosphate phosphatase